MKTYKVIIQLYECVDDVGTLKLELENKEPIEVEEFYDDLAIKQTLDSSVYYTLYNINNCKEVWWEEYGDGKIRYSGKVYEEGEYDSKELEYEHSRQLYP